MHIHVTGPFKGTYSLAVVNREFARSLIAEGVDVTISDSTEDNLLSDPFFAESNLVENLIAHSDALSSRFELVTQNNWPVQSVLPCSVFSALHCFAWEESLISPFVAHRISKNTLVTTTATSVSLALYNSGVTAPIFTIGNGTDHIAKRAPHGRRKDPFTFLHVSSCFDRKGIKELVLAFLECFNGSQPVKLVIKTFRNQHNADLNEWLSKVSSTHQSVPCIEVIYADLSEPEYRALIDRCDCLVAPSYGEGFLIPAAEAFQRGIPVITAKWGGQVDFCTAENSWLIEGNFVAATSHVSTRGSLWFKPNFESLRSALRSAFASLPEDRNHMAEQGQRTLADRFKWSDTAQRFLSAVSKTMHGDKPRRTFSIVTTWDQACGIATFSEDVVRWRPTNVEINVIYAEKINSKFVETIQNGIAVRRSWWRHSDTLPSLLDSIGSDTSTNIIIQHHPGIISWEILASMIEGLCLIKHITLHLHSVRAGIDDFKRYVDKIGKANRIIVHNAEEYMFIVSLLGVERVSLIPHGIEKQTITRNNTASFAGKNLHKIMIGTFGLASQHKRCDLLMLAGNALRDLGYEVRIKILAACSALNRHSTSHLKYTVELAHQLNFDRDFFLRTEFLPMEQVLSELSECDCLIFPYDEVSEGASGAVRIGLRAGVPVIVSSASMFDDIRDCVSTVNEQNGYTYAVAIRNLLRDSTHVSAALYRQRDYMEIADWDHVSASIFSLLIEKS